ncbi:M3 family metallopeptidase [Ramlibacter sp. AN1133]|uniref:M3 family metallopeptidase n=1 Tax=Ramlibacter sp. AN1133 TaxID=3133429 RepID=UPI0030C5F884
MPSDPSTNPLLAAWTAPYGLAPFAAIEPAHFEPAFAQALQEHREEIEAIAHDPRPADFENTLAAFDRCGRRLGRLGMVFHNLCASHTSPALQAVQRRMAPVLAAHGNAIFMNRPLFARVDALHEQRARLDLDAEQRRLLERTHLDFVRAGARLAPAAQERYGQIVQELAACQTAFAQNVLHDESTWALVLRDESELAGLPEFVRCAARAAAQQRGLGDVHAITLSRSLIVPFLTFSQRRDLREQAWRAWVRRGEHEGEHDNRPLIGRILQLRHEQARLHGYATYADYALVDRMAGTPAAVDGLLDDVFERAKAALERERASLEAAQRADGDTAPIEAWDWRYWAEKVRQREFALDDAQLKPYFALEAMVQAAFDCAQRLFGLRFTPRTDLSLHHPDARAYEVHDAQGRAVGLFIQDNFARPSKRSGAWMSSLAVQARNGGEVLPVILNTNNFAAGSPTLLGFDDVRTLFHEFGHGLHGLLSNVTYGDLAGTQVLRDFVELPSQLFEHWMAEPQVLRQHARHVETGEPIPQALIERLRSAQMFGEAYEAVRYCGSAIVDMAVHRHPDPAGVTDWPAVEEGLLRERGLPQAAGINHRLAHFQHLFGGGYAAGYYVYLWAEVLDADAWEAFIEAGSPFDAQVAERLKRCIYGTGNSVEPGQAFRNFRGRDPAIEPLLRQKGLLQPA